ncbi:hypothetical protein EGH21_18935 [Halomicroarcula sp. F13]|uniref:NurA domain-containing protein n=1 Tax=Haloarcula rubra TaxID=2487747 RepID=A0AAW4PXP5_9EURY|nr:hypothetical protein [Halomicroarcula rubra]MBX0325108.1 hypothetical protein [Halomicroarcula rubra]
MTHFNREHHVIEAAFEELASRVAQSTRTAPTADAVWECIDEAGSDALVSLVGESPTIRTLSHNAFADIDPVRPAYGLDAGSTGGIQLQSGHRVCRCRSMFGVLGEKRDVWADQTLLHSAIDPYPGTEQYYSSRITSRGYGDARTRSHVVALPSPTDGRETDELVTLLQFLAEALHLQACVHQLDGPLYLDGALLPLGLASRLQFSSDTATRDSPWLELARVVLATFATAIAVHLEHGHRVFAVAKTQETNALVGTLNERITAGKTEVSAVRPTSAADAVLPWQTDRQFISQLLAEQVSDTAPETTWTYTPWLAQPTLPAPHADHRRHPLAEVALSYVPQELLSRAYFFVRIPNQNGLYRIEAPLPTIQTVTQGERERLQRLVMREMAQTKGTAQPVARADEKVRLGYAAREEVQETVERVFDAAGITTQRVPAHNRDIRWQH